MRYYFFLFVFINFFAVHAQDPFSDVNSTYDEQLPVLSPDRTILYFTRSHHPGNVGGERDPGDIWSSFLYDDGTWSSPVNEKELNHTGFNGVIGFTLDARVLYLLNHYGDGNKQPGSPAISRVTRNGKRWSKPENIKNPYFSNRSSQYSGYLSPDGQYLLLTLESYQTVGGEDIYVCFNEGKGKWSEPKNLGKTINTSAQEFTPYLSPDNTTLYFSSNGHGGQGSSDVFMSKRQDDTWKNWTNPVPVPGVNTQGREQGYRNYEGFAIFSSTINSDGFSDLKFYAEDPEAKIKPIVTLVDSVQEIPEEEITGNILYGTIKNSSNREAVLNPQLQVFVDNTPIEITGSLERGYYEIALQTTGEYRFELNAPGYISTTESINIQETTGAVEKNFLLQPIEVGTTVQLPNVLFQRGSPNILPESYPELDRVVDFMRSNPAVYIRLEGHTDNTGVAKHNIRLSKARVESVKEYLVEKGIRAKRITGKGYGGSKPIADNSNEETRRLNRRVEFTITKN